jgi:phosphoribosylglycinamide formyltransferase-1
MSAKLRVGVLISGRGSNLKALLEAEAAPECGYQIALVISNKADAGGLAHAEAAGVPTAIIDHRDHASRAVFDAALDQCLKHNGIALIALAGFMRILTDDFVNAWRGRMVNIHPSLLPLFRGLHPQRQALAAGASVSGCTVHWVTPGVDEGPIIAQAEVPVVPGDSEDALAARILVEEHRLYPRALNQIARGTAAFPRDA